jgi:hypothetical protein
MKIGIFLICACTSTAVAQTPGTFTQTANRTTARVFHIARLRLDSRGFFVGGQNDGSIGRASAELYDPSTGKFPWMRNMTHRTLPAHTVCNNVLRSTT